MKRLLLILLMVSASAVVQGSQTYALSCLPPDIEEEFRTSDAVFIGTVTSEVSSNSGGSTRTLPAPVPLEEPAVPEEDVGATADIAVPLPETELIAPAFDRNQYLVSDVEVYKGEVDDPTNVYTDNTWGPYFSVGDEVVFFVTERVGSNPGSSFDVPLCGSTANTQTFYSGGNYIGASGVRGLLEDLSGETGSSGTAVDEDEESSASDGSSFPTGIVLASFGATTMLLVIVLAVLKSED